MLKKEKENYLKPDFEVVNIELEGGILCTSQEPEGQDTTGENDQCGGIWGDDFRKYER